MNANIMKSRNGPKGHTISRAKNKHGETFKILRRAPKGHMHGDCRLCTAVRAVLA